MKLYHGSLDWVDKPEIRESDHTLDRSVSIPHITITTIFDVY